MSRALQSNIAIRTTAIIAVIAATVYFVQKLRKANDLHVRGVQAQHGKVHVNPALKLRPEDVSTAISNAPRAVPRVVHVTYKNKSIVPDKVWRQYDKYAKGYNIKFYDDEQCRRYLRDHFPPHVLQRYLTIKSGAHRADMFRYAVLYREGGVYLDVKTILLRPLDEIIGLTSNIAVLSREPPDTVYQGIIVAAPLDTRFLHLLDMAIATPDELLEINYFIFVGQYYVTVQEALHVHHLVPTDDVPGWRIFAEVCDRTTVNGICNQLDRYGFCCYIVDSKGQMMFKTRYPDFPW